MEYRLLSTGKQVMSDSMVNGRRFRTFNVIDDCTREALVIEIYTSLSSKRTIRTLEKVIFDRGKPSVIGTHNVPEFTSKDLELCAKDNEIHIQFIQPGKPMQKGYIKRFNRIYRESILDAYLFFVFDQVRRLTEEWMEEYNTRRPHESVGNLTPYEWKMKQLNLITSDL